MVQEITDKAWQAEVRTEDTKRFIRDIKRFTRRRFSAEEKIRIVLECLRRDTPIRDLCRREGIPARSIRLFTGRPLIAYTVKVGWATQVDAMYWQCQRSLWV